MGNNKNQSAAAITISPKYAPDLERMLRGLLIAYGLTKQEIDHLLEDNREGRVYKTSNISFVKPIK
jgi:hypothetical protein